MRDLEDDLEYGPPGSDSQFPQREAAQNIKSDWEDKQFRAVCVQCNRVVYASDSERQARRKGREHERTMAKYADPSEFAGDRREHAEMMNPVGGAHRVTIQQNLR